MHAIGPTIKNVEHGFPAQPTRCRVLREGFERVTCAFVCVERDDLASPGEPLVARYEFGGGRGGTSFREG